MKTNAALQLQILHHSNKHCKHQAREKARVCLCAHVLCASAVRAHRAHTHNCSGRGSAAVGPCGGADVRHLARSTSRARERGALEPGRGPRARPGDRQAWLSLGGRLTLGHHARRSPEEAELGPGGPPAQQSEVARARRTLARLLRLEVRARVRAC